MRRREFIAGLGGAAAWPFARPLAAEGQRHVGALSDTDDGPLDQAIWNAFWEGLATLGWVQGRNLRIDYRFSGGDPSRLAAYAEELVNLRPDVIFAGAGTAARAVQQRTSVIPIVVRGRRRSDLHWSGAQHSATGRQHHRICGLVRIAGKQVAGAVQGGRASLDQGRRYLFW